ncbi:MAG TPA: glycosyltransferase, partial [Patescibacteria group bacterium]|nr:glycosyltransferase [Patescibacteria group bacterium]
PYRNDLYFKYFKNEVAPNLIPNQIEYVGTITGKRKQRLFNKAKALLFPIDWEEPFGMAVIEALACGTPVVAYRRGAMPEIIEHGVNGFLADNYREFKRYARQVSDIDPEACRRTVEQKFSADKLAENYTNLYRKIIA